MRLINSHWEAWEGDLDELEFELVLKLWQGSQRQLHGRRSSGKEHHEGRCASQEPTGAGEGPIGFPQFLFPALSGRIVTGYLYGRGHEDINIKSKISTFHFANGDP